MFYVATSLVVSSWNDPLGVLRPDGGSALGISGIDAYNIFTIGFALMAAGYPWLKFPWLPEGKNPAFNAVFWWLGAVLAMSGVGAFAAWSMGQVVPDELRQYWLLSLWGPEAGNLMVDIFQASLVEQISLLAAPLGVGIAALALMEAEDDTIMSKAEDK